MYNFETNPEKRLLGSQNEYKFVVNGTSEDVERQIEERKKREMLEGTSKYMPIGSVVTTNGSEVLKLIIGFNYKIGEDNYEYLACPYPFGLTKETRPFVFNHNDIDKIYYIGYINNQEKKFKSELLDQVQPNEKGHKM